MSFETYVNQLTTWQEINEDVPEYARYHELIEELKKNKEINGLQRFLANHILPVIVKKEDQNVEKVIRLLDKRYGRTRTEKVEAVIENKFRYREDQYEDDDKLMLAILYFTLFHSFRHTSMVLSMTRHTDKHTQCINWYVTLSSLSNFLPQSTMEFDGFLIIETTSSLSPPTSG